MAKMFKHSEDADVKQLSIFETPPTYTSVRGKHFLNFHPISAITPSSNVIHFLIKGHLLKYVDLQKSQLYIKCKIQDIDGGVPDEEIVFPVNHLLQSMWKQVKVLLGGKLVSSGSSNYHYKSMIKTLFYQCQK